MRGERERGMGNFDAVRSSFTSADSELDICAGERARQVAEDLDEGCLVLFHAQYDVYL